MKEQAGLGGGGDGGGRVEGVKGWGWGVRTGQGDDSAALSEPRPVRPTL